jgi:hypothetical protein
MYRRDILCSHREFLFQQSQEPGSNPHVFVTGPEELFPQIERLGGLTPVRTTPCHFTHEIFPTEAEERNHFRDREMERLVRLIVRDARCYQRKEEVRTFVGDHLPGSSSTEFALHESNGFGEGHKAGMQLFSAGSSGREGDTAATGQCPS